MMLTSDTRTVMASAKARRSLPVRRWSALVLALAWLSGCAAMHPIHGIPASYLPPEFLGPSRDGLRPINPMLLTRSRPPEHLVDAGDVLAVYIPGILGTATVETTTIGEVPPINLPTDPEMPPTIGFPVTVRGDGTLSLPQVAPIPVRGLTLTQVEQAVRQAYTFPQQILAVGKERVLVSLQRPREYRVLVVREDASPTAEVTGLGTINIGNARRGTARIVSLKAYENDVLHALARSTGADGLPGLDAEGAVYVIRRRSRVGEPWGMPCTSGSNGWGTAAPPAGSFNPPWTGSLRGPTSRGDVVFRSQSPDANYRSHAATTFAGRTAPGWSAPRMGGQPIGTSMTNPTSGLGWGGPMSPRGYAPVGSVGPSTSPTTAAFAGAGGAGWPAPSAAGTMPRVPAAHPGRSPDPVAPPARFQVPAVGPSAGSPATETLGWATPVVADAVAAQSAHPPAASVWPAGYDPTSPLGNPSPLPANPGWNVSPHVGQPTAVSSWPSPAGGWPPAASYAGSPILGTGASPAMFAPAWGDEVDLYFRSVRDQGLDPTIDGPNVVRIPIRILPGETPVIRESDIILEDGDIVFIEARHSEVFYTGGLLGGGQYTLPRDYDLHALEAVSIAQAAGVRGGGGRMTSSGGVSALNQDVTISASKLIVVRRLADGTRVPIEVDLNRAKRDMTGRENIIIQPGDYLYLQYTPLEALGAFLERNLLEGALFGVAAAAFTTGR
jgi:hypothetical protein